MKAFCTFGILALAGIATAYGTQQDEAKDSCCSTTAASSPIPFNYLQPAPLPAGVVAGKVTGRIVFDGEVPKAEPLKITDAQAKGCTDEGAKVNAESRKLIVGADKGVQNVVVTIEVKDAKVKVGEETIKVDQTQCRFEPHIMIIPVGSTVEYVNSDKVSHNVHTFGTKNKAFNNTIPAGASQKQKLDKAEAVQIKCDIHPWMGAYLFVADTNHADMTDAKGAFEIAGLPPGEYAIKVWHESLGKAKATVTVKADGTAEPVEIKMAAKAKKSGRRRRK